MLGGEGDGDCGALFEHFGRRTTDDQLPGRPVDDVLDEIAVEEALADIAGSGVGSAIQRPRREVDIGGADCDPVLVAARRVRGPRLQQHPAFGFEPTKSATKRLFGRL